MDLILDILAICGVGVLFLVVLWVVGAGVSGYGDWPLTALKKMGLVRPVPYELWTRRNNVMVFRRVVSTQHRCSNPERGTKGEIWICHCGRGYLRRSWDHLAGRASRDHNCWWRIRPHHPVRYIYYVNLRKQVQQGEAERKLRLAEDAA